MVLQKAQEHHCAVPNARACLYLMSTIDKQGGFEQDALRSHLKRQFMGAQRWREAKSWEHWSW